MPTGNEWLFDNSSIDDPQGRGEQAVRALRKLKHPKSTLPGGAFQLDPPFERIVRGTYGPTDAFGARLVRTVYLQLGKGSRKTSLAAALALLHTCGPMKLPYGQNLVAAADRGQARVAFEEAMSIIDATPSLAKSTKPVDSQNRFFHMASGAKFQAVSSDAKKKHGQTPTFILVDELWAHEKAELWHALRTGATKTPGSLIIVATTAGRGNESPDYPVYAYAKKVMSGEIVDPTFLPIIFEAGKDDRWDDEETWQKVLPGLKYGYPDLPSLRQLANEAKERTADRINLEQFFLGIRQDNSLSPFVDMSVFDEGKQIEKIDLSKMKGLPCWIAGDLASTTDLAAVLACFLDGDDFILKAWAFVPEANLQARADRDGVPYPQWAKEGWIIPTPGNVIDFRAIERHIRDICKDHDVREIAFDPKYASQVMNPLTDEGFPTATMQQGWVTQSPALNVLERAIISRHVKWESPALRWCMENIAIHTDTNGNRLIHKGKSTDRVDLATTAWMAVSRASMGDSHRSVFDGPVSPDDFLVAL